MSSVPVWTGGADQRKQLRAAYRLGARLVQNLRSDTRELEATMERMRDRTTIPGRSAAANQITPRFNKVRDSFMALQKGLADLLATYY